MSEEIDALNRIMGTILKAWKDPSVPRQTFDKAQRTFIELLDFINEELSPHKIMRLAFNARGKENKVE